MGLILDSSMLIAGERQRENARQILSAVLRRSGDSEIAVSAITIIELAHGAARANNAARKKKREQFIRELLSALPVHPVTVSLALRAGYIDGEDQAKGIRIPLSD